VIWVTATTAPGPERRQRQNLEMAALPGYEKKGIFATSKHSMPPPPSASPLANPPVILKTSMAAHIETGIRK